MAAVALPAVLGAQAGTALYYVTFAAGMYLDSAFIMPAIFGNKTEGPKLDDVPLGRWSEGTALPETYGKAATVPGTVIWQSPLREVENNEGGGKGGGGGDYIVYKYYIDVAVAICKGPVNRITQLYADGKIIYNVAPDIDYSSTQISGETRVSQYGSAITYYQTFLKLESSGSGSPDLSLIKPGKKLTITRAGVTGDYTVRASNTDVVAGTSWCEVYLVKTTTSADYDGWSNFAAGTQVDLHQILPTYSGKHMQDLRWHLGTADQQPDPLIESYEGVGEVPGYRDTCYMVITQLALVDFGNRIPSFSAVVEEDVDRTVPQVITKMLKSGGMADGEFDVSLVDSVGFEGMTRPGLSAIGQDLQPIMIAFDIMTQQLGDKMVFSQRNTSDVVPIRTDDLGLLDESWSPAMQDDEDPHKLPDEVLVKYVDLNNDYDTGSQRHSRHRKSSREVVTIDLPIVMESVQAKEIASRMFWLGLQSRKVEFSLPPKYMGLVRESTLCQVTLNGQEHHVRVTTVERGANLSLRIKAQLEEPITPTDIGAALFAATAGTGQNPSFVAPSLELRMMNIRALREQDVSVPGIYIAGCCPDSRYPFTGGSLYESIDEGISWDNIGSITGAATMGDVTDFTQTTVLAGVWDLVNEITVTMTHGTLESRTDLAVLNGANRAVFGDEVIAFATVEYLGDDQYKLSRLLRGMRGTEEHMDDVKQDTYFILLNGAVQFLPTPIGSVGQPRQYKLVAPGGHLEDAHTFKSVADAASVRPIAPTGFTVSRDASNNISIEWLPVSRSLGRLFGLQPQLDRIEDYSVEYSNVGRSSIWRERKRQETRSDTYTAAEQTADGATPGDTVVARIIPYSDYHGYDDLNYVDVTIP